MATPRDMRLTAYGIKFGKNHNLTGFVRLLSERKDFMDFNYIIERKPNTASFEVEGLSSPVISSRKTNKRYVALRTEADLLYLKMALGEAYNSAYDIQTAETLA